MENITITEALYSLVILQDNVDSTNIIAKVRRAQEYMESGFGLTTDELHEMKSVDSIDEMIIMATRNGRFDIFG